MALSRFLRRFLGGLRGITMTLFVMLIALSACNGCHGAVGKGTTNDATNISFVPKLVKGRVLLDPEFSGPERLMIGKALKMWTDPLGDVLQMEISQDPIAELRETIAHQSMVNEQERAQQNAPEPDEDSDEEDSFVDPHAAWDPFDPRTDHWSVAEGCSDRVVVMRVMSNHPRVRFLEMQAGSTFVGYTDGGCHKKVIFLVVDRMDDEKEFVGVAAHEFGHLFGLRHDFQRKESVMYPGGYAAHCVTRRDVESFCERWKCSPKVRLRPTRVCN